MHRRTEIKTPVYKAPKATKTLLGAPLIHFLPNREILIKEVKKLRRLQFGLTSAGWVLMEDESQKYFVQPLCPVCYCDAEEDHPFELPCCKNKIHAECFLHQIESGTKNIATGEKARKYETMHLKCCFCRDLYTKKQDDFRYRREIYETLRKVQPDYWRQTLKPAFDLHRDVELLIKEKERGLPEEERGGWAIYNCDKCTKMYIPGKLSCAEELNLDLENQELFCPECEWALGSEDLRCFEHGKKYAIFKCDSCCSIASWDCYSNHYCEPCHNRACDVKFHPCPGRGKCPLGIPHPPNSQGVHGRSNFGFVIGCYKCQDASYQAEMYNSGAPDPFLIEEQKGKNFEAMFAYKPRKEIAKPVQPALQPLIVEANVGDPYDHFLGGFQSDNESESESESEEISLEPYDHFVARFNLIESEGEIESESEAISLEPYDHFVAGFNLIESESESEEAFAYDHFLEGFECEESESESEEFKFAFMNFLGGFVDESDSELPYNHFNAGFKIDSDSEESETYSTDSESEEVLSDVEPEQLQLLTVPAPRKKFSFPEVMFAGHGSFELEQPVFAAPRMRVMASW